MTILNKIIEAFKNKSKDNQVKIDNNKFLFMIDENINEFNELKNIYDNDDIILFNNIEYKINSFTQLFNMKYPIHSIEITIKPL